MSGLPELQQLLSGLASGAVDLVKAKQLAQQVQAKQATQGGGGSSGAGGAQSRTPEQRYDNLQVIKAARDDGLITDNDTRTAALDQIGVGGSGDAGTGGSGDAGAAQQAPRDSLGDAAEAVANSSPVVLESYARFQARIWGWWFSPTGALKGAAARPTSFANWKDWKDMDTRTRTVLLNVVGLTDPDLGTAVAQTPTNLTKLDTAYHSWPGYNGPRSVRQPVGSDGGPLPSLTWGDWKSMTAEARTLLLTKTGLTGSALGETAANLARLQGAYAQWPADRFAVFQGVTGDTWETNTCNLFLGDTLTLDGSAMMTGGRYFNAHQIYTRSSPFTEIDKAVVSKGDIAAWDFGDDEDHVEHVEIVMSVDRSAGTFCTRGGYRQPVGTLECGNGTKHQLANSKLRFFRVTP